MDVDPAPGGDLAGDGEPAELVPERDVVSRGNQQSAAEGLVDRRKSLGQQLLEQVGLDRDPASATISSALRADSGSRATRASTASRTVGGTPVGSPESTSVTKNALPPVTSYR